MVCVCVGGGAPSRLSAIPESLPLPVWYDPECTDLFSRFHRIRATAGPIKVRSCFGGAAIYRYSAIKGARYAGSVFGPNAQNKEKPGVEETHEQCEHVSFHEQLAARQGGFDLYVVGVEGEGGGGYGCHQRS